MAAPETVTTLDLTGKYIQNHKLSDSTDKILELQGINWFTRKIISNATITLRISHYKDEQGVEHIDIKQTLTGGLSATPEYRTLDWTCVKVDHSLFGPVIGRSRRIPVTDVTDEYLKSGWLPDVSRDGAIQAYVVADKEKTTQSWKSDMVWGFEDIDGERRHTRRIRFTGSKGEDITARLVYDYAGAD